MRWLVVVLAIVVAGCQSRGNYVYPPGESPAGAASTSHAKMPQPK